MSKNDQNSVKEKPSFLDNPVNRRLAKLYPSNLHKEIWAHDGVKPIDTLYYHWWQFMRASQDFPDIASEISKDPNKAEAINDLKVLFGDLGNDFDKWWSEKGSSIFAEDGVPVCTVFAPMPEDEEFKKRDGVMVLIPLTINRQLIQEQLDYILNEYHPGNELKRHSASTASVRIYPRVNYPNTKYDVLVSLWRERQTSLKANDNRPWWEIYCDAINDHKLKQKLMPSKRNPNANNGKSSEDIKADNKAKGALRIKYSRRAEVLYQQAEELMTNAIQGDFPKDDHFQIKKRGKIK
jgi:hypothetical protein